jgi:hypothetical protein
MGYLQPESTSASYGPVVWQHIADNGTISGGFSLDESTLVEGDTIKAGQPLAVNETTRKAKVVKVARVYEALGSSGTAIKVYKGHHFKTGDYIAKTAGSAAYDVTLDDSEDDYDTLTVSTTLGVALSVDDVLFQSSAEGASAAAYNDTTNALLKSDVEVAADAPIAAVVDGTIYARRAPYLNATMKALLPKIIFSNSK